MYARRLLKGIVVAMVFSAQLATAGEKAGNIIEVVTFRLRSGISVAEFASVDKSVEREHVSMQKGFISRESAHGTGNEWLVIVHWRTEKDADASMATFQQAAAAARFMSMIETSTMSMKRYTK